MSMLPPGMLLLLLLAGSAAAQEVRVLSPTRMDCISLADRLARHPRGLVEPARSLGLEGQALCQAGQFRAGAARLRRALRAARQGPASGLVWP
jgi:hypothetical protein